jgi:parallel beta-helix repeat protein
MKKTILYSVPRLRGGGFTLKINGGFMKNGLLFVLAVCFASFGAINAYFHATPSGAGAKDGAAWSSAFGTAELKTFLEGTVAAGNVIFMKPGTYTPGAAIDASGRDASVTSPVAIIGVKDATTNEGSSVTGADWISLGDTANMPLFDNGAYVVTFGDYYHLYNCKGTGTGVRVFVFGTYGRAYNLRVANTDASSTDDYCLAGGNYSDFVRCFITSAKSRGLLIGYTGRAIACNFTDLPDATNGYGIMASTSNMIYGCVFTNCKFAAIHLAASAGSTIIGNTFYDNAIDINATTAGQALVINNLFDGTDATAVKWTTQTDNNFILWNHGSDARCTDYLSGVDATTVYQDYNVTTGDPLFKNPAADSLQLQDASPALNVGLEAR